MKAAAIRKIAEKYSLSELAAAAEVRDGEGAVVLEPRERQRLDARVERHAEAAVGLPVVPLAGGKSAGQNVTC